MVVAISTNTRLTALGGCSRCKGSMAEIDGEVLCLQCGHRQYENITAQMESDAARLLLSGADLAKMKAHAAINANACEECGVKRHAYNKRLCDDCRAGERITFKCPACLITKPIHKSLYDKRRRRNKDGVVTCSKPCSYAIQRKRASGPQKTFLCAYCRGPKTISLRIYRRQKRALKKAAGVCCTLDCFKHLRRRNFVGLPRKRNAGTPDGQD